MATVHPTSPRHRGLDPVEALFAAYNDTGAMSFCIAVELEGPVAASAWERAVATLPALHPTMGTFVGYSADGRRSFMPGAEPVELVMGPCARTNWHDAIEASVNRPFPPGPFAPVRVAVLADGTSQLLVVTFSHPAADGMSALLVIKDLLALVSGESPDAKASLSLGDALGLDVAKFWHEDQPAPPAALDAPARLEMLELDEVQTAALRDRAKAAGSTLHAALVVALGDVLSGLRGGKDVRIMSPVNVRGVAGSTHASAVHITAAVSSVGQPDEAFRERTHRVSESIRAARTPAAVAGFVQRLAADMRGDETNAETSRRIGRGPGFDAILTNLGEVMFDIASPLAPHVVRLWGPVIRPLPHVPIVGVSLFASRLRLVSTSLEQGLLDPMLETLRTHL